MSKTLSTPEIGTKICEIFGLDPSHIRGLDLHIGPQSSTLTAHMWIKPEGMTKIVEFLEDYELVRKGSN